MPNNRPIGGLFLTINKMMGFFQTIRNWLTNTLWGYIIKIPPWGIIKRTANTKWKNVRVARKRLPSVT